MAVRGWPALCHVTRVSQVQDACDLLRTKAEAAAVERICSDLRFELEGLKSSKEAAETAVAEKEEQLQELVTSLKQQLQVSAHYNCHHQQCQPIRIIVTLLVRS
jgi:hypothetical protein